MTANDLFGEPTPEEEAKAADHPIMAMFNKPKAASPFDALFGNVQPTEDEVEAKYQEIKAKFDPGVPTSGPLTIEYTDGGKDVLDMDKLLRGQAAQEAFADKMIKAMKQNGMLDSMEQTVRGAP